MSFFKGLFGRRERRVTTSNETPVAYDSVRIGAQVWMRRNLEVAAFRNGDLIPEVRTQEDWLTVGKQRQPAWCYYNNDPELGVLYGRLYNWFAVNDARGLAPRGWHIPVDAEYAKRENRELVQLISYLGGSHYTGSKLKEAGTTHWREPNNNPADNSSGFTALPGGSREREGGFASVGWTGGFWTASKSSNEHAYLMTLKHGSGGVILEYANMVSGFSIRCLRD